MHWHYVHKRVICTVSFIAFCSFVFLMHSVFVSVYSHASCISLYTCVHHVFISYWYMHCMCSYLFPLVYLICIVLLCSNSECSHVSFSDCVRGGSPGFSNLIRLCSAEARCWSSLATFSSEFSPLQHNHDTLEQSIVLVCLFVCTHSTMCQHMGFVYLYIPHRGGV